MHTHGSEGWTGQTKGHCGRSLSEVCMADPNNTNTGHNALSLLMCLHNIVVHHFPNVRKQVPILLPLLCAECSTSVIGVPDLEYSV